MTGELFPKPILPGFGPRTVTGPVQWIGENEQHLVPSVVVSLRFYGSESD